MNDLPLVDRARQSRRSGAVLKIFVANARSRDEAVPIFIFEGRGDFGPYRVWISRIRNDLRYARIDADGKDQALDLRQRLRSDSGNLGSGVYFFVDRDFDDLKGHTDGADIY